MADSSYMTTITALPKNADDAATAVQWSDSHACTIIARTPKRITVQRNKAVLLNGVNSGQDDALDVSSGGYAGHFSGQQRYELTEDPEGTITTYSLRKNGMWVRTGAPAKGRGGHLILGMRIEHKDLNF